MDPHLFDLLKRIERLLLLGVDVNKVMEKLLEKGAALFAAALDELPAGTAMKARQLKER